jgi:hypothetical protein
MVPDLVHQIENYGAEAKGIRIYTIKYDENYNEV